MKNLNQNLELHVRNNMISDALTAVAHDMRTQTIAFSGLWSLLTAGKIHLNWSTSGSAIQLEEEWTVAFQKECYQIFKELRCHQAAPGVSLCLPGTVDLHPDLVPYMDLLRQSLYELMPEIAKPSTTPVRPYREYAGGLKLVRTKLNQQRFRDCPTAYQAIEALNNVGYTLNQDMMLLSNLPGSPSDVYAYRYASRQLDALAASEMHGTFYFRHTMDSRGRVYARATQLQPQGDSFSKAFLDFSEKKPLGEFGLGALAVHYANCSGYDKVSFADRIAWAKAEGFAKAAKFFFAQHDWAVIAPLIEDKKHAFEEYTAGMEFYRACSSPDHRLFESRLVCHQDATTSGFQFGAALLGDRETAALTNITGDCTKQDKPADLYGEMAKHLTHLINISDDEEIRKFLSVVDRKFCKKPIMTTGYGAGLKTIMKHIREYLEDMDRHDLATNRSLSLLQPLVEEALTLTASSMLELSATLRDAGKLLIERGEETITWTTPDGFTVYQQYRDKEHRKVQLGGKSGIRALTSGEIDPLDEAKMGTALPPNFIHSIDAQLVRTTALACQHENIALAAIHDSFGTHAGTFKELNTELRHAFVEVMSYDWFGEFRKANSIQLIIERGEYNSLEALLGTYMFS